MAKWAFEVAMAAIASAIFTLGGLILIGKTLKVGSKTLEATQKMAADTQQIGEAQVRAYLSCVDATFELSKDGVSVEIKILNSGQSPAIGIACFGNITAEFVGGMPDHPRLFTWADSEHADTSYNSIPAGGIGSDFLVFYSDFHFEGSDKADTDHKISVFDDANQISIDAKISWDDVFGRKHNFTVYLVGGVDVGPYYPEIGKRLKSGKMEIRTEDPKQQNADI